MNNTASEQEDKTYRDLWDAGMHVFPTTRAAAREVGARHYFTGAPCPKGHVTKRRTASAGCCECERELSFRRSLSPHVKEINRRNKQKQEYKAKQKEYAKSKTKGAWTPRPSGVPVPSDHPDYIKMYYRKNREEILQKAKERASRPESKEKRREYINKWTRERSKTPYGVAECFMRKCITRCLTNRTDRTSAMLGYTKEELSAHIESLFLDGMNWENWGTWHIDHIRPISSFLKSGVSDPKEINALRNLRPLWAAENLSKGARYDGEK